MIAQKVNNKMEKKKRKPTQPRLA